MNYSALLEKLLAQQQLQDEEISWLIRATMQAELTPAQVAAWLVALRAKGESPAEIAGCARVLREMATPIPQKGLPPLFMDTCGTGGDRSHLLNISTLVGLTLAALGIPVAKHGNRAVSSACGSADILEALGYPLDESPDKVPERLQKHRFVFLFAPLYHPAMKNAAPVRRELGVRTVFNILGPLANPARAPVQLIGVYDKALLMPVAETLQLLGTKAALVVHSEEGLDEISPLEPTHYVFVSGEKKEIGVFVPPAQNHVRSLEELKATSKEKAIELFRAVAEGKFPAGAWMVALNAAAARRLYRIAEKGESGIPLPESAEVEEIFCFVQSGGLQSSLRF